MEKGKIPQAKKGVLWAKYGRYLNYCTVWYGTVLKLACCMGGGGMVWLMVIPTRNRLLPSY